MMDEDNGDVGGHGGHGGDGDNGDHGSDRRQDGNGGHGDNRGDRVFSTAEEEVGSSDQGTGALTSQMVSSPNYTWPSPVMQNVSMTTVRASSTPIRLRNLCLGQEVLLGDLSEAMELDEPKDIPEHLSLTKKRKFSETSPTSESTPESKRLGFQKFAVPTAEAYGNGSPSVYIYEQTGVSTPEASGIGPQFDWSSQQDTVPAPSASGYGSQQAAASTPAASGYGPPLGWERQAEVPPPAASGSGSSSDLSSQNSGASTSESGYGPPPHSGFPQVRLRSLAGYSGESQSGGCSESAGVPMLASGSGPRLQAGAAGSGFPSCWSAHHQAGVPSTDPAVYGPPPFIGFPELVASFDHALSQRRVAAQQVPIRDMFPTEVDAQFRNWVLRPIENIANREQRAERETDDEAMIPDDSKSIQ